MPRSAKKDDSQMWFASDLSSSLSILDVETVIKQMRQMESNEPSLFSL